jgi:hypothetical protein
VMKRQTVADTVTDTDNATHTESANSPVKRKAGPCAVLGHVLLLIPHLNIQNLMLMVLL